MKTTCGVVLALVGVGLLATPPSAEGRHERLETLAAELVQRNPAVIVAAAAPASLAAKRATSRIPIISVYTADPIALGLVASLARPGGNVTGLSALASDYVAKSLQLLKQAAPRTSRVGVLGHAGNPTYAIYRRELEPHHRRQIVEALARRQLPAIYGSQEAVEVGGLMSYAVSVSDVFRRGALFVDKVFRGFQPAELPVEQPTTFDLAVNLKTARSLGLTAEPSLLLLATRVIE